MEGITINQLAKMCAKMQRKGLGDKKIVISSDDECNEYHQVWEGFTDGSELAEYIEPYQMCHCVTTDPSDYVFLT